MKKIAIAALLTTAFVAAPAVAAESYGNGYVGLKAGQAKTDFDGVSLTKDNPTAFGIFGGWQFTKYFAAEAEYIDLGKAEAGGGDLKSSAWGLSAIGSWPLGNNFSLYGKAGVARANTDVTGGTSLKRTAGTFGAGGQYDFNQSWGARLGYDRYNLGDNPSGKADVWSVAGLVKF